MGRGIAWLLFTVFAYVIFIGAGLVVHLLCVIMAASDSPAAVAAAPSRRPLPLVEPKSEEQRAKERKQDRLLLGTTGALIAVALVAIVVQNLRMTRPSTVREEPAPTGGGRPVPRADAKLLPVRVDARHFLGNWRVENRMAVRVEECVATIGLNKARIPALAVGGVRLLSARDFEPRLPEPDVRDSGLEVSCERVGLGLESR